MAKKCCKWLIEEMGANCGPNFDGLGMTAMTQTLETAARTAGNMDAAAYLQCHCKVARQERQRRVKRAAKAIEEGETRMLFAEFCIRRTSPHFHLERVEARSCMKLQSPMGFRIYLCC